jgi:hypothetical protein
VNGGAPASTARVPTIADARRLVGTEIAVPASSANLGPGFDTLAVALQLYLRVRVCGCIRSWPATPPGAICCEWRRRSTAMPTTCRRRCSAG